MILTKLVNNSYTDKNTRHSYLPLYEKLLISKKTTAKNVLEVGISKGGSIKLWRDFFENATVYGLDVININNPKIWAEIKNNDKIILFTSTNAYNKDFFSTQFLNKQIRFDVMLDDGPHTLKSMIDFIKLYSQIMTDDGILIIEDVQSWDWISDLKDAVPEPLKQFIKVYDLRSIKKRYDDIVFTIDKSNLNLNLNVNDIYIQTCDSFKLSDFNRKKCANDSCLFLVHSNITNNGGTHCCLSCKKNGNSHGPLCERSL